MGNACPKRAPPGPCVPCSQSPFPTIPCPTTHRPLWRGLQRHRLGGVVLPRLLVAPRRRPSLSSVPTQQAAFSLEWERRSLCSQSRCWSSARTGAPLEPVCQQGLLCLFAHHGEVGVHRPLTPFIQEKRGRAKSLKWPAEVLFSERPACPLTPASPRPASLIPASSPPSLRPLQELPRRPRGELPPALPGSICSSPNLSGP